MYTNKYVKLFTVTSSIDKLSVSDELDIIWSKSINGEIPSGRSLLSDNWVIIIIMIQNI